MDDSQLDRDAHQALIEARVAAYCERYALMPARGSLVVAVSGGADSLCLLGVLASLTADGGRWAGVHLVVAHLNHQLRLREAEEDARFVQQVADTLGMPCHLGRQDVAQLARTTRHGVEDAARHARYAFLREVAHEVGAQRICAGHTADDQLETLVMRWLRGSGLTGLSGIRPLAGDVARPLLCLTRDETHHYCSARGWAWREDASNDEPRFWRNHIRRDVLPLLLRENPNLRATLAHSADALAGDDAFIEEAVERAWHTVVRAESSERIELDRNGLNALHLAVRRRIVRRAAQHLAGGEPSLEWRHVSSLLELVDRSSPRGRLMLPGGVRALVTADALELALATVARAASPLLAEPVAVALSVPGSADVPGTRWRVCAELLDASAGAASPGAELSSYGSDYVGRDMLRPSTGTAESVGRPQMRAYLDADTISLPLTVRTWRPGDRFRPLGMAGEKKLQDYFVDARIPRDERSAIPLVLDGRHLLWVAGHRLDDRARMRPETRRVLALRLEPLDADSSDG